MHRLELSQAEADALLAMKKVKASSVPANYPGLGGLVPMIGEVQALLDRYQKWLAERTVLREVGDWVEITTPYLDRHNDYLQIYAKRQNGSFVLTDDGHTIEDLNQAGCKLESSKRQDLLKVTLNGYGVHLGSGSALEVRATEANFSVKKHNLVQAMLAVNDMFYMAEPIVASLFYDDVVAWLDQNEIRYVPRPKFTGKSGYDHVFDFAIPKSRVSPERIIQAVNRPSRDNAQVLAFAWADVREVRPPAAQAFAILNDTDQALPAGVPGALTNWDITPVPWTRREDVRAQLQA